MREIALDIHVKKSQFQKEFLDYMNDNQSTDCKNGDMSELIIGERKNTSETRKSKNRNNPEAEDIE